MARPHHAQVFATRRANRMRALERCRIAAWLTAQCLNSGKFVRSRDAASIASLSRAQVDALALEDMVFAISNVGAKRATAVGRQARAGENVPRTARPGLVACRWRSA